MGKEISEKSIKDLLVIREGYKRERDQKISVFRDITDYINPAMTAQDCETDPVKSGKSPDTGKYRYDTSAPRFSSLSADGIEGYAFGRQNPWFRLNLEDEDPSARQNQRYLQDVEKQMYRQLNRSPFYDEGRLFVRSLLDFGTAIMHRDSNVAEGIPIYRTLNIYRCIIGNNRYGEVDILIRDYFLTPQEAVAEFEYDRLPRDVQDAFTRNNTQRSRYSEYILPAGRFDLDMKGVQKPFLSIHIVEGKYPTDLRVDGYEGKPFFCSRFTRPYGPGAWGEDSPGMTMLSTIKELNEAVRNRRKISQKKANPPIKATEGMYGRIQNKPDGVTLVPAGNDYTYMNTNADLSALDQDIIDWRQQINEAYHTDFFLTLTQNIDRIKTATEAQGIQGEKAAILSAFFGRMGFEFHEPVLEDLFASEVMAGRIPPPPRHLQGRELKIDYISPLYQMQRRYLVLNSTKQAMQEIFTAAKMQAELGLRPDAIDNIDFDSYVQNIVDTYNMDERVVRDEIDVQRMRIGRSQQEAQMQQLNAAKIKADMQNDRIKALADAQRAGQGAGQGALPVAT